LEGFVIEEGAVPEALVSEARDSLGAVGLVYALLLSSDPATRLSQIEQLKSSSETGVLTEMDRASAQLAALPLEARLPLLQLCLPTLRRMSPQQYLNFKGNIQKIIETDGMIDLVEFAWQKLLLRNLDPHFTKEVARVIQYYAWQPLLGDAAILLSALAYAGQDTDQEAAKAFDIGWAQIRSPLPYALLSRQDASVDQIDTALDRLAPADAGWVHDTEGADDMPAHVKTMVTGVSLHIPVRDGALELGSWQGVYVAEHRARPHRREVVLNYIGGKRRG